MSATKTTKKKTSSAHPKSRLKRKPEKRESRRSGGPNISIVGFHLRNCTAARLPREQSSVEDNSYKIGLTFDWSSSKAEQKMQFDMTASIEAAHQAYPSEFLSASATFRVIYQVHNPKYFPQSMESGNQIASGFVFTAMWPYWREFFHNTSVRMGYPPLILPVLTKQPAIVRIEPKKWAATPATSDEQSPKQ